MPPFPRHTCRLRTRRCIGGCAGYRGRAGIYEVLLMSDALRGLINGTPDIERLRVQGMRDGMKPLRVSGALKVSSGLTTLDEVLKVAPPAIKTTAQ